MSYLFYALFSILIKVHSVTDGCGTVLGIFMHVGASQPLDVISRNFNVLLYRMEFLVAVRPFTDDRRQDARVALYLWDSLNRFVAWDRALL